MPDHIFGDAWEDFAALPWLRIILVILTALAALAILLLVIV